MSVSNLPVSTIVTISVATPQAGLSVPQVNNLCILSKEVPIAGVPAAGYFIYENSLQVGTDWGTNSETYQQAQLIFGQRPNILAGGGQLVVYPLASGGTITTGVQAVEGLIFCGAYLWAGYNPINSEIEAGVTAVQALNKMIGVSSYLTSDTTGGGLFTVISTASQNDAIMLLYTQAGTALGARLAMAAFMGRGMSTDFTGSNTTLTMQLKDLIGVLPDSGITPTLYNTCLGLGVNMYANIQGIPKAISAGGPSGSFFFDNTYNLEWFANSLQVAAFNALATTPTKIPQTEQGMNQLKAAVAQVCQQAVTNGYLAPGTWTATDTFGDQAAFERNIEQNGFYIYSAPLSRQSAAARAARQAPLIQLAVKLAGAVHTSSLLVFLNP